MYDSGLSDWTVVKMGPKRDTLGELAQAIRAEGLHFGLSSHRAEHNFFFDGGRAMRSDVNDPKYAALYGPAHEWIATGHGQGLDNDWTYVSDAWTRDWLARDTELVEKYKPEVVYFDWWIGQPRLREAVTRFAAFYYNYSAAHGATGVIDIKDFALNWKAGARDFERGQQDHIVADHWQTDTSISNKSWGYIENDTFKTPEFLVRELVDIVSKNGNLLLNVGPRPDGTIPDEVKGTLLEMGAWLKVNGEAIYGTTPWKSFGEGPTQVKAGAFHDEETKPYTAEDFRFTAKGTTVYAIGMACPADGKATIHSLGWSHEGSALPIALVELLGSSDKVTWTQGAEALEVALPAGVSCKYAYALKLTAAAK
jgi:alpha-L-fucosidase